MIKNPYESLLDPEKVANEPDFFNVAKRKEGSVAKIGSPLSGDDLNNIAKKEDIIASVSKVMDPEIPVNIYDLGLIYNIDINDKGDVDVIMTLTAPGCPVAGEMPGWVANAVKEVKGTGVVSVKLTWSPAWNKDMMSDDAKMALDF